MMIHGVRVYKTVAIGSMATNSPETKTCLVMVVVVVVVFIGSMNN